MLLYVPPQNHWWMVICFLKTFTLSLFPLINVNNKIIKQKQLCVDFPRFSSFRVGSPLLLVGVHEETAFIHGWREDLVRVRGPLWEAVLILATFLLSRPTHYKYEPSDCPHPRPSKYIGCFSAAWAESWCLSGRASTSSLHIFPCTQENAPKHTHTHTHTQNPP